MADHKKPDTPETPAALSPEMMEMFIKFIAEMKKPQVDEALESRKEKNRLALRAQRAETIANLEAGQNACNHLREDGTNRVAFMQFFYAGLGGYDWEGYCQGCNKHFKRGSTETAQQLRVPGAKPGMVF